MPKINQLPSHVADLIAAGEVVERPGSVVKELTENAIDAGATTVTVEIKNGGITFIRVTDNGCGMAPEDAETAFLRHATSKIAVAEDLDSIHTLGFRGEALAAISAVSRIDLLTREPARTEGVSLHLESGVVTERSAAGCPAGTTILVRDLFYRTPARMKFLKRDTAEGAFAFSVVQKQALAHPEVAFRFLRDGEELLSTPGDSDLHSAIYAVLGRQTALEMVPVENQWERVSVRGFVTKPTATRGSRSYQHFFVNGRYIKSKALTAALEDAYKNQIMVGRFPACVLQITVPAETVDVNVHPTKIEVKFLSERAVFDAVHYGVLASLSRTPARPEIHLRPNAPAASQETKQLLRPIPAAPTFPTRQTAPASVLPVSDVQRSAHPTPDRSASPVATAAARNAQAFAATLPSEPRPIPAPTTAKPASAAMPSVPESPKVPVPTVAEPPSQISLPLEDTPPAPPEQAEIPLPEQPYRVIGEALDSFLIVEQGDAILFIDKHAAHERILFEKLKAQPHTIMSQVLLTPIAAKLDQEEAALLLQNADLLQDFGYEIEDFGGNAVLIRQIPADIDAADAESSLMELAELFRAGRHPDPISLRDDVLHTIACKAAIKAGWHTEPAERDALIHEVLTRDDIKYCPHGRPVCITLTKHQLEHQFKRS